MRESGGEATSSRRRGREPGLLRTASRGGARLKAIIWLLILGAGVYVCYKVVPLYINNYELTDEMKTEARFVAARTLKAEEAHEKVWLKVQELKIPARREDIRVESNGREVRISLSYSVLVDLGPYQRELKFNPVAEDRAAY